MRTYCLDASLLINGWNRYYRVDVVPQVWNVLGSLIESRTARIPWEIAKEINKQRDGLSDWMQQYKGAINRPKPKELELELMRVLMSTFPNIAAQGGSTNAGDPWVIVLAQAEGAVVVTDERPQTVAKPTKPPKITLVCDELNVPWMRPIDFLADVLPSFK